MTKLEETPEAVHQTNHLPGTPDGSLRIGDRVRVKKYQEILETLDENGTLDEVVFMPEMLPHCGREYQVLRQADLIVFDGSPKCNGESPVREFIGNDVVFLDDLRCAGISHGGCNRACRLLWKEAWLEKLDDEANDATPDSGVAEPSFEFPTVRGENYYCQSSELLKATKPLSYPQRFGKCVKRVTKGEYSFWSVVVQIAIWSFWTIRYRLLGEFATGTKKKTPAESLNLQPGELVEVKSLDEIKETLDVNGFNRGLHFSPDMRIHCGKQYRVKCRTENLIDEGTGIMRKLPNTVLLDDVLCDSRYYCFGECPRGDYQYWREIWLKRIK